MKKNRFIPMAMALAVCLSIFSPTPVHATAPMEALPGYALLVDASHDEVLYSKNGNERAYPASITKVMTALLTLEAVERGELTLDQLIVCQQSAVNGLSIYGSTQDIRPGESMSVQDLLHCLLLPSANEASNILAEAVAGDIESFVVLMNERADALGCTDTNFVNTHGLHDDAHYSTPYDIYLFFSEALENETFVEIIGTTAYETAPTERSDARKFYNSNALMSNWYYSGYTYSKAIGGKTGTTPEAGSCLVSAAINEDEDILVSVILNAELVSQPDGTIDRQQFSESRRLLEWGFDNFDRITISPDDSPVTSVAVTLSEETDEVLVRSIGSISRTLPTGMNMDDIETEIHLIADTVEAPVKEGQKMGTITMFYEGTEYGTLDLVALSDVEKSEFLEKKQAVEDFFAEWGDTVMWGSVALIALLFLLRIYFVKNRRSRRRTSGRGMGSRNRGNYGGKRR